MRDDAGVSESAKNFVETARIENFGCVRDVSLELMRLHALIGPNDSGKSTVLAALRTAGELIRLGGQELFQGDLLDPRGAIGTTITMAWDTAASATEIRLIGTQSRHWRVEAAGPKITGSFQTDLHAPLHGAFATPARGARLVRWDPDAIRSPCDLIPESGSLTVDEKGQGIPAIYEAILSRDRRTFDEIEAGLRRHFPTVKSIWLPTLPGSKKALGVTLNDGTKVHAREMSEGLLYWLAFAVLPHIDPAAILLIEEPENGLHPSRIAEVMKVLRAISSRMQVILATHSPLVINELQPEEVTILTRSPKTGTRATRLDRTKHFQQRQNVYAPGELWLSFADGDYETALVPDETSESAG